MPSKEPAAFRRSGFRMPLLSRLRLWSAGEGPSRLAAPSSRPPLPAYGSMVLCRVAMGRAGPVRKSAWSFAMAAGDFHMTAWFGGR